MCWWLFWYFQLWPFSWEFPCKNCHGFQLRLRESLAGRMFCKSNICRPPASWNTGTDNSHEHWLGNEERGLLSRAASETHISELWRCTGPLNSLSWQSSGLVVLAASHISTTGEHHQRWQDWDQGRLNSSTEWEKGGTWGSKGLWKLVYFIGWYQSSSNSTDKPILLPLRAPAAQRESFTALYKLLPAPGLNILLPVPP